jgi:glyoxylase-like metal-dependent hydrolase (beta-lactamase superfamily II)
MPALTTRRRIVAAALAAPLAAALGTARAQEATPVPVATPGAAQGEELVAQLTRIAENVYVFRSMNHQTLFIVTDEGVIAADPIGQTNPQAPELYRAAIAAVTDQPVRYVVYSHDHQDHNEGGAVFADEAQFVAHRLAAEKIAARPDSQAGRSPVPTELVDDVLTLELGGERVELLYMGRNHSDNSLVLFYPARRILFGVDFLRVNNLPSPATLRLTQPPEAVDLYLDEWIESLRRVEELDFDVLVPGHPPLTGTKADVRLLREYLEDSRAAFVAARDRGVAPDSEAMVAELDAALAPKYGQVGGYANSVPAIAQAWARELAGSA